MDKPTYPIAENLKRLRKAATPKITQEKLAELADVDRTQIVRYESGEVLPELATVYKLAKALGVHADILSEPPPAKPEKKAARR